jgi:hypothetical protein
MESKDPRIPICDTIEFHNPSDRAAVRFAINFTTHSSRASPTSPSFVLRIVVLVQASLTVAQPLEYLARGTSLVLTVTPLFRSVRSVRNYFATPRHESTSCSFNTSKNKLPVGPALLALMPTERGH